MISLVMVFRIRDTLYNDLWELTQRSINDILRTADHDFEFIIIDNGSHDSRYIDSLHQTHVLWGGQYPRAKGTRLLRFDEHVCLGKAWNTGVHQADGDYILIANNDIVYHEKGWMSRMIDPYSWRPEQLAQNYIQVNRLHMPDGLDKTYMQDVPIKAIGIVSMQHMSWYLFGGFCEGSLFIFPHNFRNEFDLRSSDEEYANHPYTVLFDERFQLICDVDFNRRVQLAGYATIQVNHPPLQPAMLQHIGHQTIQSLSHTNEIIVDITHQDRIKLCEKWGFKSEIVD